MRSPFRDPADDHGGVAAEFAVTLPALLLVMAVGVGALGAGAQAIRLQDAASDVARLAARADDETTIRAVAAAAGATRVDIGRDHGLVCVELAHPLALGPIPTGAIEVSARSCAVDGGR